MAKDKRSFFERLTGSVSLDQYDDEFEDEEGEEVAVTKVEGDGELEDEEAGEGQLTVDVYQTPSEIIIKSLVAGVRPEDLEVSITRDMVTIRGKREAHKEASDDNYFYNELYWGSFSRTILLPQEIEVEDAEATEKHGLLTLRLPKIDKEKQTKLKVKTN